MNTRHRNRFPLGLQTRSSMMAPSGCECVHQLAQARAQQEPDAVAFVDGAHVVTFGEILAQAGKLAAALHTRGLRSGDVVSFQLPNWVEAAEINLAASMLGLVCNPIIPIYRLGELKPMLADCGSRMLFVPGVWRGFDFGGMGQALKSAVPSLQEVIGVRDASSSDCAYSDLVEAAAPLDVQLPPVDAALAKLIMYTSGTTGPAKGVVHSHITSQVAVRSAAGHWGLRAGDTMLMPSPITHMTGYLGGLEAPFTLGIETVLMDRWNAVEAVQLIERHRVDAMIGATPFLHELLSAARAAGTDLPTLDIFVCGGAAVPPALIEEANEYLRGRACRGYGSTEAPFVTFGSLPDDPVELSARSDGRINAYEVRIVDNDEQEVAAGIEGELLVRGESLFSGYSDPTATRSVFTTDGFFRTGDIALRREDGALTITGRKKDVIIRGGENISAKEIEDVLHQHPDVAEVAVVSMPHVRLGETVCAFAVLREGARLRRADIVAFVSAAGLARQKCPEHLEVVDDLPRTPSGKIRKDLLRKMIADKLVPGD